MKPLSIIILLLIFLSNSNAQTNEKKKRPSWSEDLPERQEQPDIDMDDQVETIDADMGLSRDDLFADDPMMQRGDTPNDESVDDQQAQTQRLADQQAEAQRLADQQAETQRLADQQAETQRLADQQAEAQRLADQQAETQRLADEQAQAQRAADAINKANKEATEPKQPKRAYPWNILEKVAAEYPVSAIRSKKEGWVDVELTLAPNGTIIDAKSAGSYRNYRPFIKPAIDAAKKWRYEPPANYGVTENLTKTVRLIFKLN